MTTAAFSQDFKCDKLRFKSDAKYTKRSSGWSLAVSLQGYVKNNLLEVSKSEHQHPFPADQSSI